MSAKIVRILCILGLLCSLPFPARAQNVTTVSATIADPNGIPYSFASIQAQLVPTGITPTINGQQVASFTRASADVTGTFSMNLASNAVLSPGGTQWQFTVNEAPGIAPPAGTGPQSFSVTLSISGGSQSITAVLNAVAPKLSNFVGIGTICGSIASGQVAFGSGSNCITGSNNFNFGLSLTGALTLNTPTSSCATVANCTLLVFTNSGGGTTPVYFYKGPDNSFCFQNDSSNIPSHGQFCFSANGTLQLLSGANGPQCQFSTVITTAPAGSINCSLPDTGVGTALLSLNIPGNASESAYTWDTGTGCSKWYPINSSTIVTTLCPPASGAVNVETTQNSGSTALNTGVLAGAGCEATITVAAANVTTSSRIVWNYATDPSAVAGYGAAPIDAVHILVWPTSGNVNFKQCSSVAVTPGAISILWNALS